VVLLGCVWNSEVEHGNRVIRLGEGGGGQRSANSQKGQENMVHNSDFCKVNVGKYLHSVVKGRQDMK
jgi:hypothetical protein